MLRELLLALQSLLLIVSVGWADETYPSRAIRLVHGFAPGGNADTVARIVSDEMSRGLGQPVIVEAKPGAGGNIASGYVAKSTPDGYTIQLLVGGHTVSAALYKSLNYDPVSDYTFISTIGKFPFFVAAQSHTYASLSDLIKKAKAAPGTVKIGHSGVGTTQHLTGELLGLRTGVKFLQVPYRGGSAASTALLGGQVDLLIDAGTVVRSQAEAGNFDILAVTTKERWADSPTVPTISETVAPGFDILSWTGIGAPAGIPKPAEEKLLAEVHRVLALPEVQERLKALGAVPWAANGEEMKTMIEQQINVWKKVVAEAGVEKR